MEKNLVELTTRTQGAFSGTVVRRTRRAAACPRSSNCVLDRRMQLPAPSLLQHPAHYPVAPLFDSCCLSSITMLW
ncbi:hypothetical protein PMKS-000161 [Pichia membranifaciens]|uniref:Uncharacterized protein n=1 Tax=Pichia membranifaciens TaxID=4926 RepID=A0A1Q2YAX9_9ASCO|nr:hypothetical protein PMKS-000161 [Pichia membranifaciens]